MADLSKRDFETMITTSTDADSPYDQVLAQEFGKNINSLEELVFAYEYIASLCVTL